MFCFSPTKIQGQSYQYTPSYTHYNWFLALFWTHLSIWLASTSRAYEGIHCLLKQHRKFVNSHSLSQPKTSVTVVIIIDQVSWVVAILLEWILEFIMLQFITHATDQLFVRVYYCSLTVPVHKHFMRFIKPYRLPFLAFYTYSKPSLTEIVPYFFRQSARCCGISFLYVGLSNAEKIGAITLIEASLNIQLLDLTEANRAM